MKQDSKILIVDDDKQVLKTLEFLLETEFDQIRTINNPNLIPSLLREENFDVILLDMNFTKGQNTGNEGFYWLNRILKADKDAIVVLITAYGDVELAVRAIREGAMDFILKPFDNDKLLATINTALSLRKSKVQINQLKQTQRTLNHDLEQKHSLFKGNSEAMDQVFSAVKKVAKTDANVLILGENGTGKEVIARAIHKKSLRKESVFISVDMGTITESLFESELFGHKKGAFTDAKDDRAGRFEIANNGTLFLDEIGNLSPALQAKLLTVIQRREITRVGANKVIPIDIRLVCATNMPVYEMVDKNEFRQDLLYRINTVEIHLPPLRDRGPDLAPLSAHFIDMYCKKYRKPQKRLASSTLKKFEKYHWPGNIRELQHAIERAVIMSEDDLLQPSDFLFLVEKNEETEIDFSEYDLDTVEKMMIQKAISKNAGNISKAAKSLGLTRASLYRRLEKHGL